MEFPIAMDKFKPLKFDSKITDEQLSQLKENIQTVRDALVFMTSLANAKGLGGHTGGAYDIAPEVCILGGFKKAGLVYDALDDGAGHRVSIQYVMAAINGKRKIEDLFHYREYKKGLFGHPELDVEHGITNSSGRSRFRVLT